jgi:methyl-accepting chemotaxis protein
VTGLASTAGQTASAMTETRHSADELRRMSDELLQTVAAFRF